MGDVGSRFSCVAGLSAPGGETRCESFFRLLVHWLLSMELLRLLVLPDDLRSDRFDLDLDLDRLLLCRRSVFVGVSYPEFIWSDSDGDTAFAVASPNFRSFSAASAVPPEAIFSPRDTCFLVGDRDRRGDSYSFLRSSTSESTRDFFPSATSFAFAGFERRCRDVEIFLGLSLLLLLLRFFFLLPERSLWLLFLPPLPLDVDCRSFDPSNDCEATDAGSASGNWLAVVALSCCDSILLVTFSSEGCGGG